MKGLEKGYVRRMVRLSLREDVGQGDITTRLLPREGKEKVRASIIAEEKGVVAGLDFAEEVFRQREKRIVLKREVREGSFVSKGRAVLTLCGKASSVLSAERVALNFLSRLSGIASLTREHVARVRGTGARIYDTRKTTPGLRLMEKYAVRLGGGYNHRMGLWDMVLVKDNHWRLVEGSRPDTESLMKRVREFKERHKEVEIEIEAQNRKQVQRALKCGADIIMLDNMDFKRLKKAVRMIGESGPGKRPLLEVSGGIHLENVRKIAGLGVERISIGGLTHSAKAMNFSLELKGGK